MVFSDDPSLPPAQRQNQLAYDRMAKKQHPLAQRAKEEELRNPLAVVDAVGWLGGSISGQRVLLVASGGGRQSALYCAAGANVTVVDISGGMLELDRQIATEYQFPIRTFQASMESMPMLRNGEFDLVIQPVSTCYVPDVIGVFREIARVLKPGGLYISQHKQPVNLQASLEAKPTGTGRPQYTIEHAYYDSHPVAQATSPSRLREPGTQEFVHRLEVLLGGMCRSGFVIEDVTEPFHGKPEQPPGSFGHRCHYIAPYIRLKARRTSSGQVDRAEQKSNIWLP